MLVTIYLVLTVFCCFLYGGSSVLCKYALQHQLDINTVAGMRRKLWLLVTNKLWLLGVFISALANVIIVQIQSDIDVSLIYSILNFSYVFTLLLGFFVLNEFLTRQQWYGVLTVILGTVILLFVEEAATGDQTDLSHLLSLTVVSIASIVSCIYLAVKNKRMNYEILYAVAAGVAFGGVETFLKTTTNMVAMTQGDFSVWSVSNLQEFISIWPFFMMAFFSALGFIFMQIAYSHGHVSLTVPLIVVTQRPVTLFSGYYVFGEEFTMIKVAGIITILFGIMIIMLVSLNEDDLEPSKAAPESQRS